MLAFLYTIIIFPVVQIIDVVFVCCSRIFHNTAVSIIGSSFAVTLLTLPLYFAAEKMQKKEREIQKRLAPKTAKIKQVFKGDEQYMILSTYYRQNRYHPAYALRNTFGLLIQIPFFIAAYSYLAHLDAFKGTRFLFISDLSRPDTLLSIREGADIHVLPILMTLINIVSGAIYTKGLALRDKIQVYGTAAVFLVLLYNSPSGLVLYWTMNNIFSLSKNLLQKIKNAKRILYGALFLFICYLWFYFVRKGFSPKRFCVLILLTSPLLFPLAQKSFRLLKARLRKKITVDMTAVADNKTFIFSAVILFLLAGLTIPSLLIASSVQEFSFIEHYTSPFPFIANVCIQAAGLFLFWFICLFFIFPQNIRRALCFCVSLATVFALFDTFVFPGDFGFLSTTFVFSKPDTLESQYKLILLSAVCFFPIFFLFSYFLLSRRKFLFLSFQIITASALFGLSAYNLIRIQSNFSDFERLKNKGDAEPSLDPVFVFSQTGKNVLIIMLDKAISGYIPYIFEEKPELDDEFSGFVYYPNCVSFGSHTRIGAPALFGGYEYMPELIHKNRKTALKFHNEALLVLPRIFSDAGYRVTVTDPSFANYSYVPDLSIYEPFPEIRAENLAGKYAGKWLKEHPEVEVISISNLLKNLLIRFSVFKMALPVFRIFIYDRGDWLSDTVESKNADFSVETINCWTTLDILPEISRIISQNENTLAVMVNDLPHYPEFFDTDTYRPSVNKTRGAGLFANDNTYHVNIASYIELAKWFAWMKSKNIYDNTRIIIASDHGADAAIPVLNTIDLPAGENLASYNSVLLVKDFNALGMMKTDTAFMTQADVPLLATRDVIDNPINPWSNKPLASDKEAGATITTASVLKYTIEPTEWLHVQDDIFKRENWSVVSK